MPSIIVSLATVALVYRAWSRKSLTPAGIAVATSTAVVHALHPWSIFFWLLATFFLLGTSVTKVKHDLKSTYTTSSTGGSTSAHPPPRTAAQVLCNSLPASIFIALHLYYLRSTTTNKAIESTCLSNPLIKSPTFPFSLFASSPNLTITVFEALPYGIIASYASAAADTFSSELGILAKTPPFLITDLVGLLKFAPKKVPRGTNGGVTIAGIAAGFLGAAVIGVVTIAATPFCNGGKGEAWTLSQKTWFAAAIATWGLVGSIVDSVLGAVLQASVVDSRTGKVVEGDGGVKVLFDKAVSMQSTAAEGQKRGRRVVSGHDVLSNNEVNLLMLSVMASAAVGVACLFMTAT